MKNILNVFFSVILHYSFLIYLQNIFTFSDDRMDGINQWNSISEGGMEIRKEFIYNIYDLEYQRGAIR